MLLAVATLVRVNASPADGSVPVNGVERVSFSLPLTFVAAGQDVCLPCLHAGGEGQDLPLDRRCGQRGGGEVGRDACRLSIVPLTTLPATVRLRPAFARRNGPDRPDVETGLAEGQRRGSLTVDACAPAERLGKRMAVPHESVVQAVLLPPLKTVPSMRIWLKVTAKLVLGWAVVLSRSLSLIPARRDRGGVQCVAAEVPLKPRVTVRFRPLRAVICIKLAVDLDDHAGGQVLRGWQRQGTVAAVVVMAAVRVVRRSLKLLAWWLPYCCSCSRALPRNGPFVPHHRR